MSTLLTYIRYRMWTWWVMTMHDTHYSGVYWSESWRREDNPWKTWFEYTEGSVKDNTELPLVTALLVPFWFLWSMLRTLTMGARTVNSEESWRAEVFLSNVLRMRKDRRSATAVAESDLREVGIDRVILGWHRMGSPHADRRRLYVALVKLSVWSVSTEDPVERVILLSSAGPRSYQEVRTWLRKAVLADPVVSLSLGRQ